MGGVQRHTIPQRPTGSIASQSEPFAGDGGAAVSVGQWSDLASSHTCLSVCDCADPAIQKRNGISVEGWMRKPHRTRIRRHRDRQAGRRIAPVVWGTHLAIICSVQAYNFA